MAGLLRDSKHEDNDAEMGRVASPPIQMLHLETKEETKDQSKEPNTIRDTGVAGEGCKQLP